MPNESTENAGGDIRAMAGSKLPEGERQCPRCRGNGWLFTCDSPQQRVICPECDGIGVETKGASLPSTSVLSPPVPSQIASWAGRLDSMHGELVEVVRKHRAALNGTPVDDSLLMQTRMSFARYEICLAALRLVDHLQSRPEGGDNAKAD